MAYDLRCSECGRFCKPVDRGIYYGECTSTEPYDPELFCQSCYDKNMLEAKTTPEKVIIKCWWMKPDFISVAKSVLRHRKRLTFC